MKYITTLIIPVALFIACGTTSKNVMINGEPPKEDLPTFIYDSNYIAVKFRNPVGNPPGRGYYDANPFMNKTHLGEDWNGTGGGNSDLGDTVYACANGYIHFAEDVQGGWGKVVRILHQLPKGVRYKEVESLYAHFDQVFIKKDTYIKLGTPIGTIGTANGIYPAHLHFEMRHDITMEIGGGYSSDTSGYLNPKQFIKNFNAR